MVDRHPLHDLHELQTSLPVLPPERPPTPFSSPEECMTFVRTRWKVNYDIGKIHDLLYPSTIVEEIAIKVVSTWLRMEQYFRIGGQHPTSSGGNVLITGTKGVGKTTLMKGLATIINSYSGGHVRAVYYNFEEDGSLLGPSQVLGFDRAFTTEAYNQWCLEHRKCLIFFGDEFDTLYASDDRQTSIRIAREILSLGKSTLGFGIISGSSAGLKSLAFKEDPDDAKHNGFPNLNCTVYVEYRFSPVREKLQLEEILRLRGRDSLIEHVNEVFCKTGGVGRMVDEFREISAFVYAALPKIEDCVDHPRYGEVIRSLYVANHDDSDPVDYFKQKGLTEVQLRLANHGHRAVVMELIDKHFVHTNGMTRTYEFLYPYHIIRLREIYADVSRLEYLALETTLKGWQGFESAGQVLEPLIIRTLVSKRKGPFSNPLLKYDNWEWHIGGSSRRLVSRGSELNVSLDLLYDNICVPIPYDGLDSFVLMRGEGNSVLVGVTQIKCGELGKKITPGTAKSSDASKFFTAIVRKANVGWESLLPALTASFPGMQFTLASFALVTNKAVAEDVTSQSTVRFSEHEVPLMVYCQDDFNDDFLDVLQMFNISPPN
eukprot:gene7592-8392_t